MPTEAAIKEVNYNVESVQIGKSVKLNKERQKLKIGALLQIIFFFFYKILMYIYIFSNLSTTEFSFDKKALFHK